MVQKNKTKRWNWDTNLLVSLRKGVGRHSVYTEELKLAVVQEKNSE